eukprot:gene45163-57480_t
MTDAPHVIAVCASTRHEFSKSPQIAIRLVEGLGIEGDAHAGTTVQHIYDKRRDPTRPNLRQVHLIHAELFDELETGGFAVRPGDLGENVSTRGVDLLNLPRGTLLRIGPGAVVEVTGLRSPCVQIDRFEPGLLAAVRERVEGKFVGRTGVMGIVRTGGDIAAGDGIE